MRFPCFVALLLWIATGLSSSALAGLIPETVSYISGKHSFAGYLYTPKGKGPFPAVIWNHGHSGHLLRAGASSEYEDIARLYVNDGYIVFIPDRHMHDVSTDYSKELQALLKKKKENSDIKEQKYREYLEINALDVAAAVE